MWAGCPRQGRVIPSVVRGASTKRRSLRSPSGVRGCHLFRWEGAGAHLGKSDPEQDEEHDPQVGQSVGSVMWDGAVD